MAFSATPIINYLYLYHSYQSLVLYPQSKDSKSDYLDAEETNCLSSTATAFSPFQLFSF
jgi:hypothetical protein